MSSVSKKHTLLGLTFDYDFSYDRVDEQVVPSCNSVSIYGGEPRGSLLNPIYLDKNSHSFRDAVTEFEESSDYGNMLEEAEEEINDYLAEERAGLGEE